MTMRELENAKSECNNWLEAWAKEITRLTEKTE